MHWYVRCSLSPPSSVRRSSLTTSPALQPQHLEFEKRTPAQRRHNIPSTEHHRAHGAAAAYIRSTSLRQLQRLLSRFHDRVHAQALRKL
jgi:predicted NodU family carbamoyl transferase